MKLAVFGNPVAHSKSPQIHTQFASSLGLDVQYTAIAAPVDGFAVGISEFVNSGGVGANVTVPFKQQAYALAEQKTARAELAGAVNTLIFSEGVCKGDNTDGVGLMRDIIENLAWKVEGKKIVIFGAGGAVRGILQPLIEQQPASIFIANRTEEKSQELVAIFNKMAAQNKVIISGGGYSCLKDNSAEIIINATSSGLHGEMPVIPTGFSMNNSRCYDMVYGNTQTVFCAWAQQQGAQETADGLGMLVEQAAVSFEIWTGHKPATAPVIKQLRAELG